MEDDIVLKIKEKESFELLKVILIFYFIFLFFLALILKYQETIIEVMLIAVFAIILDALNSGEMVITEKGITTKQTKFIRYSKIDKVEYKTRILYLYVKERKKPFKIIFSKSENQKSIENVYKFIDSKVKKISEEEKEQQEYVEKYL